ncbi:LysR family transcriptional regulator [Acetobacter sacchari]|uniref:LysR family transcriptional regulator n=1 Tax=Acetobacter sacchari TaxID=2661687 RepID=A0ABS3M1E1_9PROT|nr:LysR family transcriptional regulator [Acetobacter sacchari]
MKLDPRTIAQFVVIAEEASFTRAAERLHVAQPWLSARVRKLEDQIGFPLFIRNTRNVALTKRGAEFLQVARTLAASIAASESLAAQLQRQGESRLRVGAPPYSNLIPERLRLIEEFSSLYSDVSIELDIGWTPTLIDRVRSGHLDLAFVSGDVDHSDLDVATLHRGRIKLMMPHSHPLAVRSQVTLAELRDYVVVVFTRANNPKLFDTVYSPLKDAGAKLLQMPELCDSLLTRIRESDRMIAAIFDFQVDRLTDSTMVGRPLAVDRQVPFSLVRRAGNATPLVQACWAMALRGTPITLATRSEERA